jgi:hypothetical protein
MTHDGGEMIIRMIAVGLLLGGFALAGCGSSGAAAGSACMQGSDCAEETFCLVTAQGKAGVCTAYPTGCSSSATCSDACFDEAKKACAVAACIAVNGEITLSCQ